MATKKMRMYQSPHEEHQHRQYEFLDFSSFWVLDNIPKLSFRIFLNICMYYVFNHLRSTRMAPIMMETNKQDVISSPKPGHNPTT